MFHTKLQGKSKQKFYANFFADNPAAYGIMWKNIVRPDRPQMTIW